jgi:hypothetical protein
MQTLYCACCGRPFHRASPRGPAPLYCSADCRAQMQVRRRVWAAAHPAPHPPAHPLEQTGKRRARGQALPVPV